jgi:phage tail sheath protein FI
MSNYVRVEISSDVDNQEIDATALPCGFRGISHLVTSGSAPLKSPVSAQHRTANAVQRAVEEPVPFRMNITRESGQKISVNPQLYWGVQFEHTLSLTTPNASNLANVSLNSFAKYFPSFFDGSVNFVVGDNSGEADTTTNGIMDADRFCHNMFSLENISVVTGTTTLADSQQWVSASYIRNGVITANDTLKTRALKTDDFTQQNAQYIKFSMIMQGGFNGVNLFDQDEAELTDAAVSFDMLDSQRGYANGPNVKTYHKAIDIMQNVTNVDIQLLAIPGLRQAIVTDYALEAVQDRFDAMLVMDIEQSDVNGTAIRYADEGNLASVQNTAQTFIDRALDTSFGAAYFPDVVVQDPTTKTNVIVPPSVVVMGAFALNDAVGHPWFAPAGFTRGALPTTLEAAVKLSKSNMDTLYDANINPLVAFVTSGPGQQPQGGVVVWGQKTLQQAASALDRVNVRRLLIEIRRQVRQASNSIIFEPNRATTLAKFTANVTPRLQRIQQLAGLQRFKVIIDSSTTTQQDVENNTIRGKIFVQPYKAVEFVSLDFVVTNTGNMTPNA